MQEELYLRKVNETYQAFLKDLNDKSVPYHLEFPFKEAAVVIVFPDGKIDAIRVSEKFDLHIEYYRELLKTSEKFANEVRKRTKIFNIMKETITNPLDNSFASDGIVVFRNLSMDYVNYVRKYETSRDYFSEFFAYLPEDGKRTCELIGVLDTIKENYDDFGIVENVYDPALGRCKSKEKENKR